MHTGLVILTCFFRIIEFQQLFITVTIFKLKGIIILIEFGAIPGVSVADMDQFNEDFTMTKYWAYLVLGIFSGFILGMMTRWTHSVCRTGLLRHEVYLAFYSSLTCVVLMPALIGVEYIGRKHEISVDDQTAHTAWIWAVIVACVVLKTLIVDRILNKRFTIDFDKELPSVPEIVDALSAASLSPPPSKNLKLTQG